MSPRRPGTIPRRRLLAASLAGVPGVPVLAQSRRRVSDTPAATAIDFARSFCYYVPRSTPIWVRIQLECRCRLVDAATGAADEYVLGVRTQTGLRSNPPSDSVDPGYDFWMIFSRRHVFIRRVHTSSYNDNSTRVPVEEFVQTGWRLEPCPAEALSTAAEIGSALRAWRVLVGSTEFASTDGGRRLILEYPIKWADGAEDGGFRVETGPVLTLDPDRARVGSPPEIGDFRWTYLDYRSFDRVRCLRERPTSIFSGAGYSGSAATPRRNPPLDRGQVARIEDRLFQGWTPPVPVEGLRRLLQTDHYSEVTWHRVRTRVYALAAGTQPRRRDRDNG